MVTVFNVEKMMCSGCEANIKKVLADIASVDSVKIDIDAKTVTIEDAINTSEVAKTISDAGYSATIV